MKPISCGKMQNEAKQWQIKKRHPANERNNPQNERKNPQNERKNPQTSAIWKCARSGLLALVGPAKLCLSIKFNVFGRMMAYA